MLPGNFVGAIAGGLAGRFIESLLFGATALDPSTYVAVSAVLSLVAVLAAFLPARRAARLDPVRALQTE